MIFARRAGDGAPVVLSFEKEDRGSMTTSKIATAPGDDHAFRPSRVIAEALVQRHGPHRIVARASKMGLSPQLTRAMVVACCATAVDPSGAPRRRVVATT